MALRKQVIPVTFTGGLDSKTAKQLVMPGKFLVLENCYRQKIGKTQKRSGFTALPQTTFAGTEIDAGAKIVDFQDDLVLINREGLYSYASPSERWASKGSLTITNLTATPVIRNTATQAMPDIAYAGSYACVVWEDSRASSGVKASVIDMESGSPVLHDTVISATGTRPKVVAIGPFFIITYVDGTDIKTRRIATQTPTTVGAAQTLVSNNLPASAADRLYDVVAYDDSVAFYVHNTSGSTIRFGYMDRDGTEAGSEYPTATTFSDVAYQALSAEIDRENDRIYIMYYDDSVGDVLVKPYSFDFVTTDTALAIETIADVRNITGVIDVDSKLRIFYEVGDAADSTSQEHQVKTALATWAGTGSITATAAADCVRGVGLMSKAFLVGDVPYVGVVREAPLQATGFIVNSSGLVVTKIQPGLAGGLTRDSADAAKSGLPHVVFDGDNRALTSMQVRNRLVAEDGDIVSSNKGLVAATIDFAADNYSSAVIANNLIIAGGAPQLYDGVTIAEQGFHFYPEGTIVATPSGAGAVFPAGEMYSFIALYEWIDAKGQVHRSAPSIALTGVDGDDADEFEVEVPTLLMTAKTNVKIVLYRTVGNGSIYYRAAEADNSTSATSVTITDDTADADIQDNEVLYTTGGQVENIALPSCTIVHKHKNRLFAAGLESPNKVLFSKEETEGEAIGTTDLFVLTMASGRGGIMALGSLDDKLAMFKTSRISVVAGQGPTAAGAQDDYGVPQDIVGDVGCATPNSVCETPAGLIFASEKGIYLLDRSLQSTYVGAAVEDYNDLSISSAQVLPDINQVRFTTSDGVALVYDYFFDQWSTFTNYTAVSAAVWRNTYVFLTAAGQVNQEVADSFEDNGARISMAMETSWMSMAGIQGFQRVYLIEILGEFVSHHYTKISIAYDFENFYNETKYFDTREGLGTSTYGDGATYGSDSVYGGTGSSVFQCELKPRIQKCESIKLRIEDVDTIGTNGGGSFMLTNVAFTVGSKKGGARLGEGKRV